MSTTVPPTRPNAGPPAEKVKSFPTTPGVYLSKGAAGRVLYAGKAKDLRSRASHYFTAALPTVFPSLPASIASAPALGPRSTRRPGFTPPGPPPRRKKQKSSSPLFGCPYGLRS
jgi:hypothetical protein